MALGYPCMNRTLREGTPVRCNRSMQKRTWEREGLSYASELALQNFRDLEQILAWNVEHGISFYRCTSELVPWHSQYTLEELPDFAAIESVANACGDLIEDNEIRFSFHPSHWVKLGSQSQETVERGLTDLNNHGRWLDLMGLDRTPYYGINIHIGAKYDGKDDTAARFRAAIDRLSPAARDRLTVENDDTESLWSVPELVEAVAKPTGVPVVFDYHHHTFTDRGYTYREAFDMAADTWSVRPAAHYSEPKRLHEDGDPNASPQAHAETVRSVPEWLTARADVMIEAGGKERVVLDIAE